MSDEELMISFVRTGNNETFTKIVKRFQRPIVVYFKRCGRQHADAEELAQDVFLQVVRCKEQYEPGKSVNAWIFSIATHLMIDRHRSETHARAADAPEVALTDFAEFDIADRRTSEPGSSSLLPYLNRLPEQQRSLIESIYFDRLTWAETGQKLGMDQGRMYRQHTAAMEQLRCWLMQLDVAAA